MGQRWDHRSPYHLSTLAIQGQSVILFTHIVLDLVNIDQGQVMSYLKSFKFDVFSFFRRVFVIFTILIKKENERKTISFFLTFLVSLGKTRFFHTKRLLDAWGGGGFAGGRFKNSVKDQFLTEQIF